jgi:nitroreductase
MAHINIIKGQKMKNEFLKAMDFRHACKLFDENKKISDEDISYILECARKSPSSFGMEAWKFLVITNQALKEKLRPLCWDQVQITSCSHLVVVLAGIDSLKPENGVVRKRFQRRAMPQEKLEFYLELYASHLTETLCSDENIYAWSAKQTYIAAANMMTGAAMIGIDSCAIEGFDKNSAEELLGLDKTKYQLSMVLPLGYRINEQSEQLRCSVEEVVEYIK